MTANVSPTFSQLGRSPSIGGPPAYTTGDLLAARNQKYAKVIHLLRIAMAAVTLGASVTVIACEVSSLKEFSASHLEPEWLLPLWPLNVDLRPAHAVLGCGIVIAAFSLIYLAAALIPMPHKFHNLNLVSTTLSFLSLFATLFTIIYSSTIINSLASSTSSGSLTSWTCKWKGFESIAPAKFTKICNEGMAALDLMILLVIVEMLAVGLTAWGWWVEMRLKRFGLGDEKDNIELV
ncbi:hypothetical protein P7C71_g4852, partial [Lecanoromycetidae sp. Uapishka_2]